MLELLRDFFERKPNPNSKSELARQQHENLLGRQKSEREAAVAKYGEKYVSHFERVAWLKMRIRENESTGLYSCSLHDMAISLAETNDFTAQLNKLERNPPTKKPAIQLRTAG